MADVSDLRIDPPTQRARPRTAARFAVGVLLAIALIAAGAAGAWFIYAAKPDASRAASNASTHGANANPPAAHQSPTPPASGGFTAAGYVEVVPPGARIIASLIPGVLDDILIREGENVRAGQRIASLGTALLEQELVRGEAEVDVLRARLARLEAGYLPEEIAKAEARLEAAGEILKIAEANLAHHRELAQSGVVSRRVVTQLEVEVVEAARTLKEAEYDLHLMLRGPRPEDLQIARAELARAEADLAHTEWKLARCAIVSPIDGVVFQQLAQPGQWVAVDSAIMSVFDPAALQAWVDVNQRDLPRIRIGQRVTMTADASPGSDVSGRVIQLMPRASIERNTVRVRVSIEGKHENLRPDMSLRVTFHE